MLDKLKNKQVKLIVGSNSGVGAGITTTGGLAKTIATSGIVIASGILSDFDEEFVGIINAQLLYMNVAGDNPILEKHNEIYLNKKSIISISAD